MSFFFTVNLAALPAALLVGVPERCEGSNSFVFLFVVVVVVVGFWSVAFCCWLARLVC